MHEILNQQESTLVLFNSKEVLRYVYETISETMNQAGCIEFVCTRPKYQFVQNKEAL